MYSPLLNRSSVTAAQLNTTLESNSSGPPRRLIGDDQADAAVKTPSFLFGQKRRSVAPGTQTFLSSPFSGQNAPSSDIFASPVPSHLRGESTTTASGKSVHWSPALVKERNIAHEGSPRSTVKTPSSQTTGQFTHSSNPSPAPPLRSIREDIEPVRKAARRSMNTPVLDTPFLPNGASKSTTETTQTQSQSPADTWVTVYGFPPEQAGSVLKHFSRHGEIVSHQIPKRGNWMHIRYSCPVHARQALSRNATLIDSAMRIGVVPCTEKDIVGVDASRIVSPLLNRSSILEQSHSGEVSDEIPAITLPGSESQCTLDDTANRSNLSVSSRAGMRS
ncbi:hypothetical protein KIN20_020674 [Parelaphostrongylus tenuis]|uniref:Nucleoporin NUP35 n=1 Tax=Parelaphostrongylus tenuis TaxID=148309 RepID=A0AAD5MT46_PARTN|nr:hypothetical protein KIN20_020674 [Parelaphostrongylus tenuis]